MNPLCTKEGNNAHIKHSTARPVILSCTQNHDERFARGRQDILVKIVNSKSAKTTGLYQGD
jgi:hypothetical protein